MFNNPWDHFFSGGGFVAPSQATQTTEYGVSPAKNRDAKDILLLTVKQISDSDDVIMFLNNVKLVGMMFDIEQRFREVTFALEDQTGRIDCHRWVNDDADLWEMAQIKNGTFAEIHGHLKCFKGKKYLEAFCVRPVNDIDQLAYRFKECMDVHCHNTKSQCKATRYWLCDLLTQLQPQIPNAAITNGPSSYQTAPSNQCNWQPATTGIIEKVLDFLFIPTYLAQEKGAHLAEVAQHLKVPPQEIMEAIRDLEEEGMVYSTIDEFHYKISETIITDGPLISYQSTPSNQVRYQLLFCFLFSWVLFYQ
ncbi:hypothetical protein MKW94_003156 [Papaver nudicaule]|uniref:Replication protein A C-terminal domain-containing protein n=1 Tax=Papaver nudicaule TaxID=74823 RepID=A0AA41SMF1_PAPNU|nr:hypothetical protein [Papaver nudicaule]